MIRYFIEYSCCEKWFKSSNDPENKYGFTDANKAYRRAEHWTNNGQAGIYRVVEKEIQ